MKTIPDPAINAFGAEILLKHLNALEKEIEGVSSGAADIEFVHRMRVATRRLRAAIPLFPDCMPPKMSHSWIEQIRKITQALGAARDADVQIASLTAFISDLEDPAAATLKPGAERLLLRLRQQRQVLQPPVVAALEKFETSSTLPQMKAALQPQADEKEILYLFTQALYQHAAQFILARLDDFLAFDEIVSQPKKVAELHQMRIAAKRLRYTLENFQTLYNGELKPWLSAIRSAQDTLGEVHDCDVWAGLLPVFLMDEEQRTIDYFGHGGPFHRLQPGIEAFLADRQASRAKLYQAFNKDWDNWSRKQLWEELRASVQAPLLDPGTIYPPHIYPNI